MCFMSLSDCNTLPIITHVTFYHRISIKAEQAQCYKEERGDKDLVQEQMMGYVCVNVNTVYTVIAKH